LLSCPGAFSARNIQVWQIVMTHAGGDTFAGASIDQTVPGSEPVSVVICDRCYQQLVGALRRELFFSLKEAQVVIENWRQEYSTVRPHSSLNKRTPGPEAILILAI